MITSSIFWKKQLAESIYSETVSIKTNKSESSKNSEFLNVVYGIGKLMKKQLPKV